MTNHCQSPLAFGVSPTYDDPVPDNIQMVDEGPVVTDGKTGLKYPAWALIEATLPNHPELRITIRVVAIDGVYEPTAVSVESESVDTAVPLEVLRQIPIRSIVRSGIYSTVRSRNLSQVLTPPDGADRSDEATTLRHVAQVYRIARLAGTPPTEAVKNLLHVSRATAARRVAEARKAGELGVDEVGQAGGARSRIGD